MIEGKMKERILEAREWIQKDRPHRARLFDLEDAREILDLASQYDQSAGKISLDKTKAVIYALSIGLVTGYRLAEREIRQKKNLVSAATPTRNN